MLQPLAVPASLASSEDPEVPEQDCAAPPLHVPKPRHGLPSHVLERLASPQRAASQPEARRRPLSPPPPPPLAPQDAWPEAAAAAGGGIEPQQGRGPLRPGELVEGSWVEYYSESNSCWMPCVVVYLDSETGAIKLDIKPNQVLSLDEQRQRLRPRTRPNREQLEWVRGTLREGRVEEEAQAIFGRHAQVPSEAQAEAPVLLPENLHAVGAELDARLGISGAVCALRHVAGHQVGEGLSTEGFGEVFWELLWGVQKDFCQALPREPGAWRRREHPEELYSFERTLGQGTFGLVKLARSKAAGAERAVKMISKQDHVWGSVEQMEVEIEHLCLLDHPHIVRLYEHFEDATHIYLVMDFCSGGELQGMVNESRDADRDLPEAFVSEVMRQVLLAIAHVHARGIVHLDLKSANIMLMPSKRTLPPGRAEEGYTLANIDEKPHVMVIDLGVAQIFRPGNFKFNRPMGTPVTMAPEVWMGEIHPKADIFSCGVVLFELLSLEYPFACPADMVEAVRYWNSMPPAPWALVQHAPEYAAGLCRRMLVLDRRGRPTASQCLQAPFLQVGAAGRGGAAPAVVPQQLVRRLLDVPKRSLLHKSVALSIARDWPANQLPTVKRLFHELDAARSGRLGREQLELALERFGAERTRAREAAEAMDLSRDGTVCWTEFVAACIDLGSNAYEQHLREIFDKADTDEDGLLSQQDLSTLLPAEHLREDNAVRDVFADLAGRTDPGARVDWPSFRQHFLVRQPSPADPTSAGAPGSGGAAADASHAAPAADLLEQARGLVEWARETVWPEARGEHGTRTEEQLRQLAEMGFTNRERCLAVLRKHQNRLSHLVIDELVEGAGR